MYDAKCTCENNSVLACLLGERFAPWPGLLEVLKLRTIFGISGEDFETPHILETLLGDHFFCVSSFYSCEPLSPVILQ